MTSSARIAGLVLLAAAQAAAQQAGPAAADLPPLLQQRVAGAVAERWAVAPERVRLEWGAVASRVPLAGQTAFRLLGRGDDGWFAVVFEPASGPSVAVKLRAGLADSVAVAGRALAANAVLGSDDVRYELRVRWQSPLRDESVAYKAHAGDVLRRPVLAGEALVPPAVAPAPVVEAGAPVRIEWRRGAVAIELQGTAVNAAALGEPVQVRVDGRTGQLRGSAVAPNTVRVGA